MGRYSFRSTVEESSSFNVFFLKKHGYFCGYKVGAISWSRHGVKTGSISIIVNTDVDNPNINLIYSITDRFSDDKTDYDCYFIYELICGK